MTAMQAGVALGSNLGDRAATLDHAVRALGGLVGTLVLERSDWIETAPVGGPPQGPYLNGVVILRTEMEPRKLLTELQRIEQEAGRSRTVANGPRTLDLDLLFHGDTVSDDEDLCLPHPRLHRRGFVLEPLHQVAPDWKHPTLGLGAAQLLERARARIAGAR